MIRALRIERRLDQPRRLYVLVPAGSLALALGIGALILVATGHDPGHAYARLFDAAFLANGAISDTITSATPLMFTGLAAAAAFRMQLFNIGGEGQLFFGAIASAAAGLALGGAPNAVSVLLMILAGAAGGALWALIPGLLRAYLHTNEIITSLMLNYVAGLVLNYLIFDSLSYWRDLSGSGKVFPQGRTLPDSGTWPAISSGFQGGTTIPLGFLLGIGAATALWFLFQRTRFGFEVKVIGDSQRAARYSGMRTRRTILAVMAISGALAGIGGASQNGDFRHQLDARGLGQAGYGYTGIVVAALARYNPFLTVVLAILLGGLQNAGYALQGADFPSGLVGVLQGVILFCALAGELLFRYRIRIERRRPMELDL